jgi:type IV pilus assembly protein PilA
MKKFMGKTMAKMNENRRNGRKALKGFTLVEIIVVLVILAILAAAMIPALTGYIDKARNRTVISEARNAVTAAQTLASEAYGVGKMDKLQIKGDGGMEDLAEVPGKIVKVSLSNKGKVVGLIYVDKEGDSYVAYMKGEFSEVKETTTENSSYTTYKSLGFESEPTDVKDLVRTDGDAQDTNPFVKPAGDGN